MVSITAEIEVEVEEGVNNADRACKLARKIANAGRCTWNVSDRNEEVKVDGWEVL